MERSHPPHLFTRMPAKASVRGRQQTPQGYSPKDALLALRNDVYPKTQRCPILLQLMPSSLISTTLSALNVESMLLTHDRRSRKLLFCFE
jgi:hypothetical protein